MTYVKNARHLVTVARGFEPKREDAARLLTDALAHALHEARRDPDDAVAQLRDSFETIEAAGMQSGALPSPVAAPAAKPAKGEMMPCPFCGGPPHRLTLDEDDGKHNAGGDVIYCKSCGASSHVEFGFKENLVDRWNTRVSVSPTLGYNL